MRQIWFIAKKDLMHMVKDFGQLFFLIAMPLIMILLIGSVMGNILGSSETKQTVLKIAITNQDQSFVGQTIQKALQIDTNELKIILTTYTNRDQVLEAVKHGDVDAGAFIPAQTSEKVIAAANANQTPDQMIDIFLPPSPQIPSYTAQSIISTTFTTTVTQTYASAASNHAVGDVCKQPGNVCQPGSINTEQIQKTVNEAILTANANTPIHTITVAATQNANAYDTLIPGYAVFFAMFGIQSAAGTILKEKEDGTFRRLLIAPVSQFTLLAGKMLAQFIITFCQLALFFAIGYFFLHINLGEPLAVFLLLISTSLAITGLGMIIVAIARTRGQMSMLASLFTLGFSLIGGAWFPRYLLPDWVLEIGKISLVSWTLEGLNGIMIQGKGLSEVLIDIGVLLLYGAVCLFVALRIFNTQQNRLAS